MNLYNLIFEMVVCIQIEIYEFVYQGGRRARGLRYALAARASPSQLALRARGLRYALAARASPLQLARSRLVCTDLEKT